MLSFAFRPSSPPPAESLPRSRSTSLARVRPPSTISGSSGPLAGLRCGTRQTLPAIRDPCCQRKPPHTTHLRDFPDRVTVVRPHHPFEGRSLEVFRHTHRDGRLHFVLILPDGSKSLVPAEWTDFEAAGPRAASQSAGSLEDWLRMRSLVDALLRRAGSAHGPATPVTNPASPAAGSALHGHFHPGEALVRGAEQPAPTDCRPGSGAAPPQDGASGKQAGDDQ